MIMAVHTQEEMQKERELFAQLLQYCDKLDQAGTDSKLILELLDIRKDLQQLSTAGMDRRKLVDILDN